MRSLLPLRSLTVKLGLVLFGLVFVVIAVLLLVVVPRLESRLVDARIDRLEQAVAPVERTLRPLEAIELDEGSDLAVLGSRHDARVTVLVSLGDDTLTVFADSALDRPPDAIVRDPVALRALQTRVTQRGRVERDGRPFAEVAFPLGGSSAFPAETPIVVLSAPLGDVLRSFDLMRKSLLVAGGLALLGAAVLAYLAAWGLTRRLRRLEAAAEQIAAGDFSQPVVDRGRDEVAQLARAFENMRERLANLERVRREFIQNASHELRTPLFSLGGFIELLEDEELDEATRREFLAETRAQIDRLAKLATDLLDLSRLDAGQLEVEVEDVELAETARIAADEFRPAAEAGGHELRIDVVAPAVASADNQRVLQVVRILVQNAIRHTPDGTPIAIVVDAAEGQALLEVRDGGPGIAPEALPHVFERFYRAPGGRTSGSGLGLSIGSELARRMGADLTGESKPGSTVFRFTLPASTTAFPREKAPAAREEAATRA
jgi:signal transduction histidine kinase